MQQLCPVCGATIEERPTGNAVICPSCGTQVVGDEQDGLQRVAALRLVGPPAVGLMALAVMLIAYGCFGGLTEFAEEVYLQRPPESPKGIRVRTLKILLLVAYHILVVSLGVILLVGGRSMRRLRSRRWALAAAIAALVPTPFFIFGIPFGIWSLFVLTRPSVKTAFPKGEPR